MRSGFAIHGSCGQVAPGTVAVTYESRRHKRIDVYELFYNMNAVARAGFLVHEAGPAVGAPDHANPDQDQRFEDQGPYGMQLEFLAAVYYNDEAPQAFRKATLAPELVPGGGLVSLVAARLVPFTVRARNRREAHKENGPPRREAGAGLSGGDGSNVSASLRQ